MSSQQFCQFWIIFDYMLFTGSLWTMAIASIQRYWLVFHRTFFDKHLILLHYIPLSFCIIYPILLYSCLVTKYSCVNNFDYSQWTCGGACYLYQVRYKLFTLSNKITIVICSIVIFNVFFSKKMENDELRCFAETLKFALIKLYSNAIKFLKDLHYLIIS